MRTRRSKTAFSLDHFSVLRQILQCVPRQIPVSWRFRHLHVNHHLHLCVQRDFNHFIGQLANRCERCETRSNHRDSCLLVFSNFRAVEWPNRRLSKFPFYYEAQHVEQNDT